jgi:hypothetical protein
MKTTKIIVFILIVFFLNLELIFMGVKNSKGSHACSCSTSQSMCNLSNSCCCRTEGNSQWQTNHDESKSTDRRKKTETYISEMSCGDNQTKILPLSTVRIYILTEHPSLVFNQRFSFHKPFPCYMPEEYFKNPPYKPPQKLIPRSNYFYFI